MTLSGLNSLASCHNATHQLKQLEIARKIFPIYNQYQSVVGLGAFAVGNISLMPVIQSVVGLGAFAVACWIVDKKFIKLPKLGWFLLSYLLKQNDEYKSQIDSIQTENIQLKKQYKLLNDEITKLRAVFQEKNANNKHLREEKCQLKTELNEAYNLLSKIEKDKAITTKKIKIKHKDEMEKLCNGFLESFGADPGTKDINSVIKDLRMNNIQLKKTVDILAELLARKQQSLIEALEAVDNVTMKNKKNIQELQDVTATTITPTSSVTPINGNGKKIKNKLKEWNQRRKSFTLQSKYSSSFNGIIRQHSITNNDFIDINEIKEVDIPFNDSDGNDMNAKFFKNESGESKLIIDTAKTANEMQFLSEKLTNDVVNNRQNAENEKTNESYEK